MNLLPKTIAIITITLLLTSIATYFLISQALFDNYVILEQQDVKRDVQTIHNNLEREAQIVAEKMIDWSQWDDCYRFALKPNKAFIDSNLTPDALVSIKINAILIFNNARKLLVARSYRVVNNQVVAWKIDGILRYFAQYPELITHDSSDDKIKGIVNFEDDNAQSTAFFASEPIRPSNPSPNVSGTIVFFRLLDQDYIEQLLKRQQVEAIFHPIHTLEPQDMLRNVLTELRPSNPILVKPQDEAQVSGFSLIRNYYQQPIFLLEVHKHRDIYVQGKQLINNTLYILLIFIAVFLLVTLVSLSHWVLFPLFSLLNDVQKITRSSDIRSRVRERGNDELGKLSREINIMLNSLDYTLEKERRDLLAEKERSEVLLNNILPSMIAQRMRRGELMIAEYFQEVTVLFSDIVGFTKLAAGTEPQELVKLLNIIFSEYDSIADKYDLEKIKTIGDAYMVVSGVPLYHPDHAQRVAWMALEMRERLSEINESLKLDIAVRIGIASGEVIAGIIGKRKFSYDLWGDTVNTASRMESHGVEGKIQCTENFYRVLQNEFIFEPRGFIEVKNKGKMFTYFLIQPSLATQTKKPLLQYVSKKG